MNKINSLPLDSGRTSVESLEARPHNYLALNKESPYKKFKANNEASKNL